MKFHYISPFLKVFSFEKGPILIGSKRQVSCKGKASSSENNQSNIIRIKSNISNSVLNEFSGKLRFLSLRFE